MKLSRSAVTLAALALCSGPAMAQSGITSELDASFRMGLGLDTEPDTDLSFRNFGSRLRWNGAAEIDDDSSIISYLEFGFDQDEGVGTTRQAWVGYEGDFGTVKGGKQYRAFYDAVSSQTDIAWWGSCELGISCTRQSGVVKYSGVQKDGLQLMASATLVREPSDSVSNSISEQIDAVTAALLAGNGVEDLPAIEGDDLDADADSDVLDELDFAARLAVGDMTVGAAIGIRTDEGDSDTGIALGLGATMPLNDMTASATAQFATDDYLRGEDNGILLNAALKKDQYYGVFGLADEDNTPFFLTLGYERPLIDDRALTYFELEMLDTDEEGADLGLFLRAVVVFNFDVVSTGG